MAQFKVGDKVKVNSSILFGGSFDGKSGEVYMIDNNQVYVRFEDGGTDYGFAQELELVESGGSITNITARIHNTNKEIQELTSTLEQLQADRAALIVELMGELK